MLNLSCYLSFVTFHDATFHHGNGNDQGAILQERRDGILGFVLDVWTIFNYPPSGKVSGSVVEELNGLALWCLVEHLY